MDVKVDTKEKKKRGTSDKKGGKYSGKEYKKTSYTQTPLNKALNNLEKALKKINYYDINGVLKEVKKFDALTYLNMEMLGITFLFMKDNNISSEEDIDKEFFIDENIKKYIEYIGTISSELYFRYKSNILRYTLYILKMRNNV